MQAPAALKHLLYPDRGGLSQLRFFEDRWISALVPDQERFGLARELVLQRIYDRWADVTHGTVVDAGANVGLFSMVASQHARQVVALEPNPVNHRILDLNLYVNNIGNVTPLRAALWKEDGEVRLAPPEHEQLRVLSSTGSHVVMTSAPSEFNAYAVEALSLETLVERYGEIDLLKLDIEGAEEEILPTSRALPYIRRIIAELHLTSAGQELPMVTALRASGFDVQVIPSASLYTRAWVRRVLRNWRNLDGQLLIKLGLLAYLLAPITKPRRPGRDMPLLIASQA